MNSAPNFNKKLIYGLIIVVLFGVMFPYTGWLAEREENAATWARPPSARSTPAAS